MSSSCIRTREWRPSILLAVVREHPEIDEAVIAGAIRGIAKSRVAASIVARCRAERFPSASRRSFTRLNGVREATGDGSDTVRDSLRRRRATASSLRVARAFAVALWRATGSEEHVELVSVAACRARTHSRR